MGDSRDSSKGVFSGEIDPEIAELIGVESEETGAPALFGDSAGPKVVLAPEQADTERESFAPVAAFEEAAKPLFADKNYYKIALGGEGETAQRAHKLLSDFLACQDPKDKSVLRNKLISAYWNLAESIAAKSYTALPMPKVLLLRFGVMLQTLISDEQRQMLSRVIFDNHSTEPLYYVDEWLKKIAAGQISPSTTDETRPSQRTQPERIHSMLEKARGAHEVQLGLVKGKIVEIENAEAALQEKVSLLLDHDRRSDHDDLKAEYNAGQRTALGEVGNLARTLGLLDRELSRLFGELENASQQLAELKTKSADLGGQPTVDAQTVVNEFNTVRQMIKMCVGRQGNHFPILMKQYLRANIKDIVTRENATFHMSQIEAIDPGLFKRTFKGQTKRIVPYVILAPCYGDQGICWEPFERFNRATSRGRIAIPMFPTRDVQSAVITALADLRWQVEKERAQHYWMEEGLTGNYYQWFSAQKLKGDVREYFIQDYLTWVTKESEGMQKLNRDVRGIFWRYLPFPEETKEKLKTRGFVYGELAKKDRNRSLSDGY